MPHSSHHGKSPPKENRHHPPRPEKSKEQKVKNAKDPKVAAAKDGKDKPKPTPGKASTDQPRPWSRWIAGDDGRWFYQARPKADGSGWEYQFTEGYPSVTRRSQGYGHQASPVFGVAPIRNIASVPAVPVIPLTQKQPEKVVEADGGQRGGDVPPPDPVVPDAPQQPQPAAQAEKQPPPPGPGIVPGPTPAAKHPGPPKATIGAHPDVKKGGKAVGGSHKKKNKTDNKRLKVVIKAEKNLSINPKSKVKGWLSEVPS